MIVFDLRCGSGHVFEAWFASSAAYDSQRADGLIACAVCGDTGIDKAVMAPNVAAKGNAAPAPMPTEAKAAIARLAELQARMLEGSEWVGSRFAERARAMHDGDAREAAIHGRATLAETKALIDDGVPVAPLPLPVVPPEARN